ncbi:GNAT family N-acetyltransferase [Corynebacterium sp. 4HC-13]|uniref:GNAT family N-acetyltransferase n=2 Tax=Corynebacterium anserum TaxID=2684406 RepID=A0A7G7YR82_9CORY|nr:GNAT family protein [Corynebacterium anserum]MBC2682031.1 GNAT family N-acetyltransferase [Corynebacterium anserum]QNH97002.1 GNAT family N-acetyltransferase [Corynebacterium anserum]
MRKDGKLWRHYRMEDERFLRPVEPTVMGSWEAAHSAGQWRRVWSNLHFLARRGQLVPAAIEVDGQFAGQLTLGNIQYGVVSTCWIGYWVYSPFTGMGVASAAVALGVDHAMGNMGLHRVEATVMEDNSASRTVLGRAGFREEGYLQRNLHINGRWQDHILMAITREEVFTAEFKGLIPRKVRAGELQLSSLN